ncbi:MAG: hypothetical protein MUC97_02320 [Bernardetiaceae bacterium]|jgi:hypothetical protein|nr:hypothetical protein [Bernardetiaceae bacterium]
MKKLGLLLLLLFPGLAWAQPSPELIVNKDRGAEWYAKALEVGEDFGAELGFFINRDPKKSPEAQERVRAKLINLFTGVQSKVYKDYAAKPNPAEEEIGRYLAYWNTLANNNRQQQFTVDYVFKNDPNQPQIYYRADGYYVVLVAQRNFRWVTGNASAKPPAGIPDQANLTLHVQVAAANQAPLPKPLIRNITLFDPNWAANAYQLVSLQELQVENIETIAKAREFLKEYGPLPDKTPTALNGYRATASSHIGALDELMRNNGNERVQIRAKELKLQLQDMNVRIDDELQAQAAANTQRQKKPKGWFARNWWIVPAAAVLVGGGVYLATQAGGGGAASDLPLPYATPPR